MAGSTIDHLISLTVLLAALLVFISLFNQTIQTAIVYQQHAGLATEASNLLDSMMLSTGFLPNGSSKWGESGLTPSGFGLQDPEFTQYMLSPFSLMRLQSSMGQTIYYSKTGLYYSNITMGFGDFLLISSTKAINYSTAARLLGINGSYGFQLTIMPLITVSVSERQAASPLIIAVNVTGAGLGLSNAIVSYSFLKANLTELYPSYTITYGSACTNATGSVLFTFPQVTNATIPYSFFAYASFGGLVGVGYHQRTSSQNQYVIPFVDDLTTRGGTVVIANSYDVHNYGSPAPVAYNATFIMLAQDFIQREMPLNATQKTGIVNYGQGNPYGVITIPTYNPGILVITYKVGTGTQGGVILMPWGLSSMGFPVIFGGNPFGNQWVATDIRQVVVDGVAYQAKLGLWSLQGYGVIG
jgi:hypothetical protein